MKFKLTLLLFLLCFNKSYALDTCAIDARFRVIFKDAIAAANIRSSDVKLVCTHQTPYAKFDTLNNDYCIIFNDNYFNVEQPIDFCGAICHELGHFIHKHLGPTDSSKERLADIYSGYLMRKLHLQEFQFSYMYILRTSSESSSLYADKESRIAYIKQGWDQASAEISNYTNFQPHVIWKLDESKNLTVVINDRHIEVGFPYYKSGIIYDSASSATYQLMGCCKSRNDSGIGRIVTNKSPLTYMRNGSRGYTIFDKGVVVPRDSCWHDDETDFIQDNGEFYVYYYNNLKFYVQFVLEDYIFAPENYLLTAHINRL